MIKMNKNQESSPHGKNRKIIVFFRYLLFSLVLGAVSLYIVRNYEEIRQYSFDFRAIYLILSFFILVGSYLVLFTLWQRMTGSFHLYTPLLRAARAWFLSHLGKYVPGKITMLLVRLEAYRGYSRKKVAVVSFVEYFCMLTATCFYVLIIRQ